MEILLAACLLAWAAGAQSECAALGISPAQRELIREQVRHDKTVRRIADKHGETAPHTSTTGVSPWKDPAAAASSLTMPEAFRAGYRGHTPIARVATPMGRRAGGWAARGVAWGKDSGRSAVREYRKRRQAAGEPDLAPILTPPTPAHPPMPTAPPTAGSGGPSGVTLAKPEAVTEPEGANKSPEEAAAGAPQAPTAPERAAEAHAPVPAPRAPEPAALETPPESATEAAPQTGPETAPAPVESTGSKTTTETRGGVGRMAAEVSYDSVMDESDELSLMCHDDVSVYGRIRQRCEREIGRADTLVAQLKSSGLKDWIARCAEQYRVILAQLDELEVDTVAQNEGVVKAKALLAAGQGYYAGIAAAMETVEDRQFYVSDAVDGEDTVAEAETYETQGARA